MDNLTTKYSLPKTSKLENLHILLWLLKDTSWLMMWRGFGLFMIIPTISCAILITWNGRNSKEKLLHNLAVTFWIIANSFWMFTEFFELEKEFKIFALIPFLLGFLCLIYYYTSEWYNNFRKKKHSIKSTIN